MLGGCSMPETDVACLRLMGKVHAGSWQGGSARGGRGGPGQHRQPGSAWQGRGRLDEQGAPRAPQLADKLRGEALYGVNPVLGALKAWRRDCHTLYVQEGWFSGPAASPVTVSQTTQAPLYRCSAQSLLQR